MERYVVTSLKEGEIGKRLLDMEFTYKDEIIPELQKLYAEGYKPHQLKEAILDDKGATIASGAELIIVTKTRKTRADAGKSHKAPGKPEKKIRSRGQFFVYDESKGMKTLEVCPTRQDLDIYLDSKTDGQSVVRIIEGHELTFKRNVKFTLEPIK